MSDWHNATPDEFIRMTRVDNLLPGDVITLDLHRATSITVRSVEPYGDSETLLTDLDGATYVLANTNWF